MVQKNYPITTLQHLLNYQIMQWIDAENQLLQSLPKWIEHAGSLQLKTVLQKYIHFIENHLQGFKQFLEQENTKQEKIVDTVMQAFITETNYKLQHCLDTEIKDACLLASVQTINHYKISTYGTAAAFVQTIGVTQQASVFYEAEISEKQIDDRLSQLAQYEINKKARTPIVIEA